MDLSLSGVFGKDVRNSRQAMHSMQRCNMGRGTRRGRKLGWQVENDGISECSSLTSRHLTSLVGNEAEGSRP